jgi:hypothetical protein
MSAPQGRSRWYMGLFHEDILCLYTFQGVQRHLRRLRDCGEQCRVEAVINDCIAIRCCVMSCSCIGVLGLEVRSRLRGKCTCLPGSACYNRISCDFGHVVTD